MCDQATQTILDGIVKDFVDRRLMFTALNVSREAQKNHGVTLRHNLMKNETHRNYANGAMQYDDGGSTRDYQRQLVDIPGVNGQAWAYYPDGVDPDNYDLSHLVNGPIDTKDASAAAPASNPNSVPVPPLASAAPDPFGLSQGAGTATATAPVATTTAAPAAQGKYAVDKRKRLWIPRDFVKAAGGTRTTPLEVTIDNKSLVITAKGAAPKTPYTSYLVDSKGNIAISKNVFDAAGLNATSYDIIKMNNRVVVKSA